MNKRVKKVLNMALPLIIGVALGAVFLGGSGQNTEPDTHEHELTAEGSWTCSMHPQVRQPAPGACPFCGMDLIPAADGADEDVAVLKMSNTAIQMANIQTTILKEGGIEGSLNLNGRIKVDERRVNTQTTHFAGRIEVLYKNYVGEVVSKGDKIASLYSPELLAAQEELIEAKRLEESNPILLQAARKKLKYWKLTDEQISAIEESSAPIRNFNLLAGFDGVITKKLVNTGDHLHEGQGLLEITDLSKVWAVFEVYEKDLGQLNVGDKLNFTTSGSKEAFTARISFISPEVDPQNRVVEVRADVANVQERLKPDMFLKGYLATTSGTSLMVPRSAVLWTGERSIVYVKTPDELSFELREIGLGRVVNDFYQVNEGLEAGEEVVTNGAFTVDAEAQLRGKISMMNTPGSTEVAAPEGPFTEVELPVGEDYRSQVTPEFQQQLGDLSVAYLSLKDQMVEGNGNSIRRTGVLVKEALGAVDMTLARGEAHSHWMAVLAPMEQSLGVITTSADRDLQRLQFINLSKALINAIQSFGSSFDSPLYVQFCPMANQDKGALWISKEEEIINPYFGDVMLNCGNIENIIMNEE
jgi:Cu(I)/Ag(I) efflux system membrane fusion protein